ncbi:hypothetical protein ACGFZL_01245 [Streptomyces sp. NPDC048182]|uniref:hypothetical protein n=1 Tax=Streptomyces sp. NPDC048182 TaxID=3365507 RepID=UPI00371DE35B
MRSVRIATATVFAGAALLMTAPLASASDTQCDPATAAAQRAESDYKAALADYQKIINDGGHPDKSQQDNVDQLKQKADSAASEAQRVCGDQVMDPSRKPSGAMHTGSGSTSSATNSTAGLAAAGALAGAGAVGFAARHRKIHSRRH